MNARRWLMLGWVSCGLACGSSKSSSPTSPETPPLGMATTGIAPEPPPPPKPPPPKPPPPNVEEPGTDDAVAVDVEVELELRADVPGAPKPPKGTSTGESNPSKKPQGKTVKASSSRSAGGAIDQEGLQRALSAKMGELRSCLREDLVVQLDATVGRDGRVEEARAVGSQPDDSRARDCVAHVLLGASVGQTGATDSSTFRLKLSLRRR